MRVPVHFLVRAAYFERMALLSALATWFFSEYVFVLVYVFPTFFAHRLCYVDDESFSLA